MAKAENLTTMERHVEKVVLLVCLLALALATWYWIVSSPLEIEIVNATGRGKQLVSPAKADGLLMNVAKKIEKTYENTKREKVPVPVWVSHLDELRSLSPLPTAPMDLATARLPLAPAEPLSDPTALMSVALLANAMPVPVRPKIMASVELPNKLPPGDVILVRGVSGYPLADLTAKWQQMIGKTAALSQVVPYKVIVEVQQAPSDGDWSKAETRVVQIPPMLDAQGDPIKTLAIPDFDGSNITEVRSARDAVAGRRTNILRPTYRPVWRADLRQWIEPELPMEAAPLMPAPTGGAVVGAAPVPQGPMPIAFFDDSTMAIGASYRYRVRLVVLNPLLTYDGAVAAENLAEARKKFITSKPSQWSTPIRLTREVHFFVTGANVMASKMSVTVYARKWGQWVEKKFNVQPGEPIGGVQNVSLVNPLKTERQSVEVDFSTGAIALRLDFKKSLLRPGFRSTTSEMIYLDEDGKLKSRLKTWDDDSRLRKRLKEAVKQAASE